MTARVWLSISAGEIEATGLTNEKTHQLQMGDPGNPVFLRITPATAAQWLTVLTPIAQEADK